MPEHEPTLSPGYNPECRQSKQSEVYDQREHAWRIELSRRNADQLAETLAAAQKFAHHRADDDEHGGILQAGEEMGHPDGKLQLHQGLPTARTHRLEQHT